MKTKNITVVLTALILFGMLASCKKDFLDQPPASSVVDVQFYQNDAQVLAGVAPLYSMAWKDFADQASWHIGDARAGVVMYPWGGSPVQQFTLFTVNGLTSTSVSAYKSFYEVINLANTVRYNIEHYASSAVTPAIKQHALGECRYMRATALMYLVMNYGPVPIVDENYTALIESGAANLPQLNRNTVPSVWQFIVKDLRYAIENLAQQAPEVGRVTSWSAEGMLARAYLNMAGMNPNAVDGAGGTLNTTYLDSAKYYSDRVIRLSGYSLLSNYATLFLYPYDNNSESMFELQWVYTPNSSLSYQYANTGIAQITPSTTISGGATDGWGGNYTATQWLLSLYDGMYDAKNPNQPGSTLDQRLKPTFMMPGATYPELIEKGTNPAVQYSAPIVAASTGSPSFATIKKYVIGYHQGETGQQDDPNDTYMMRLAEMYLTYTEAAVLEGNVDGLAVQYFNVIHSRAGLDITHTVDSLSQGYPKAWDYVFKERVKEFAMEGLAWYDLVKRSYHDAQYVYAFLSGQDRGLWNFQPYPAPWTVANDTDPQGWTFSWVNWVPEYVPGGVSSGNFMLPIPTVELSQAPSLNQAPVAYDFKNYK